jgi:hypothetical protein
VCGQISPVRLAPLGSSRVRLSFDTDVFLLGFSRCDGVGREEIYNGLGREGGASVLGRDGIRCVLCSAHFYHHLLPGDMNEKLLSAQGLTGNRFLS